MPARPVVVLVGGLWLPYWTLLPLAWRLRRCGFRPRLFPYRTVRRDLRQNASALHAFLATLPPGPVHLVGYSLGGLVIRALFRYYPPQAPGRIVTLGTPHGGSRAAVALARWRWGRWLLGAGIRDLLADSPRSWEIPPRAIGTLAGSLDIGFGRLVTSHPEIADGTVGLSESRLPGAADSGIIHTTHFGLMFSPAAARAVCRFLHTGRFAG